MNTKISVQIEQSATGFSAFSPDIAGSQVRGDTLESIVDALKPILDHYLNQPEPVAETKPYQPIWEIAQELTSDMTDEEIQQLPSDGAEQHNHYIYGTPKQN